MNTESGGEAFHRRLSTLIGKEKPFVWAKNVGIPSGTFDRIYNQKTIPSAAHLIRIAEVCQVSLDWLLLGKAIKVEGGASADTEFVGIPRYNAQLSAGHGSFIERAEIIDDIPFTHAFLARRLGRQSADGLIIVEARGDSMAPRIEDGDLVMIDTRDQQLRDGLVAFIWGDAAHIKRLRVSPRSTEVLSDNDAYPPFEIGREDIENGLLSVVGRVKWHGHVEEQ